MAGVDAHTESATEPEAIALNPALDRAGLAAAFARAGRLHIPDLLVAEHADRLHRCLAGFDAWNLVLSGQDKHYDVFPEQRAAMTPAQYEELKRSVYAGARWGFRYLYDDYPIWDHHRAGTGKLPLMDRLHAFLNGRDFLDFARAVTGLDDIAFADSQATRYGPGHLLTRHTDDVPGKRRRAAYVLNLTPRWQPDWGGYLLFFDQAGHVETGFMPSFNALNIFAVPQDHAVGCVAPFAGAYRYAITGWLRAGAPESLIKD